MEVEKKDFSKWTKPENEEGAPNVERETFISTKTEEVWQQEATAAGKPIDEYLTSQFDVFQTAAATEAARIAALAGGGSGGDEFQPSALWEDLKGKEGFVMPEGITKETEEAVLKQALIDNGMATAEAKTPEQIEAERVAALDVVPDNNGITDPDVLAFMNYKKANPEASLSDFVSQRTQYADMLALNDRDFMISHYKAEYGTFDQEKNPDGLTDDEIEDTVSALETNKTLIIEARKLKKDYRTKGDSETNLSDADVKALETTKRTESIDLIKADALKLFAETEKITELNGVKVSKAELTEINSAFEKAVIPDDKGNIPIMSMLQSDKTLWNFFATNFLGDEKFKTALFNAGDATKEDLFKRLGLTPTNAGGRQADTGKPNTITPGLWSTADPKDNL